MDQGSPGSLSGYGHFGPGDETFVLHVTAPSQRVQDTAGVSMRFFGGLLTERY